MDVVDDAAVLLGSALDRLDFRCGFIEPLTKVTVDLLEACSMATIVAADLADEETEACGDEHPYR